MSDFDNFTKPVSGKGITLTLPASETLLTDLLESASAGYELADKAVMRLSFQGDPNDVIGEFTSDDSVPVVGDANLIFGGDVFKVTSESLPVTRLIASGAAQKFRITQFKSENLFI